ncbi:protein phosphatase 1 regulatory subunit 12B-like isoform X2 [Oncorhynchus keta]|uniref:protein phosphatase 1 regulatory subunit 12B-like isoform X2 n=1 Tax=Oncorhynchus keta TaxID=8018 RepID=UPI00227AD99E|nr:protein phosphatase 1 regulatory subunit 12B-like isoform X2 [Oncorhynchus keta]
MSSHLSPRNAKDQPRTRKSSTDSSPAKPSPTSRSLKHERVSRLDSSGAYDREAYDARRENRMAARKKAEEEAGCTDYKKMYEEALSTNERLKSRLQGSKQELVLVQTQLERVTQRKITMTERSNERSMLETEKRVQTELKNENQRLKDENGALIRVISKLSK